MDIDFTDKVVLVTGASAGIGEATAIMFAKYGAKLALVDIDELNLKKVASRCEKEKGIKPLTIVADLSIDGGCETTAKSTLENYRRLDVLVNNAGIGARTCIEKTDMATFDRVVSLNVRGVYNLTRLLVPALIESKGNIVNTSSIAATTVIAGALPYGIAKAAVDHFTRLVALELAPKGVRVNAVSPGVTRTKFVQTMSKLTEEQYDSYVKSAEELIPIGTACDGEDIAKMIVHMASDNSRLLTGAVVPVDGCMRFGNVNSFSKKAQEWHQK